MAESGSISSSETQEERLHAAWLFAHDLRYSVSLLDHSLGELQRYLISGEPSRRAHADAAGILAHVTYLASSLLEELNTDDLERPAIDLNGFILERQGAIERACGGEINLTLRLSAGGGIVPATVAELDYLLMTLVTNAVNAMPVGGDLTVGTGWLDRVSMPNDPPLQPRRFVRLTVSDTGEAAEDSPHARLFDAAPTNGVSAEVVRESVAAAASRLNGWLIVEGEPHAGTRVHLCLPAISDERS